MTPYYQDDSCTIYHGDCREMIDDLEFDAVVTDPPYGTGYYLSDVDRLVDLMLAIGDDTPALIIGYPETLVRWCVALRRVPDEWVTWWPTNGACRGVNYHGLRRESECVAVFGENHLYDLRQPRTSQRLGKTYRGANDRGDSHGDEETRRLSDVWTMAAPGLAFQHAQRNHPNEKPIGLMSLLVQGVSGTVLDPFMGSGTTLRAAKDLGRKAIGIEIEERYCEIAAKRLAQGVLDFGGAA
jgi:site-specific DNA-methyltransferase (adenine-specific)